jgi:hypothetical protein
MSREESQKEAATGSSLLYGRFISGRRLVSLWFNDMNSSGSNWLGSVGSVYPERIGFTGGVVL